MIKSAKESKSKVSVKGVKGGVALKTDLKAGVKYNEFNVN